MKKLVRAAIATLVFVVSGVCTAVADPVDLDNGYLDSNFYNSFFHNAYDGDSIYLYKTPFDNTSKIEISNWSGIGVTLISGGKCFTTDIYDACGNRHDSDATINSTTSDFTGITTFTSAESTYSYGRVVITQEVSLDGKIFEVTNTLILRENDPFLRIKTEVKNRSDTNSELDFYINNFDGMVSHDWRYRMTRGNLNNGVFTPIASDSDFSNAVIADADSETFPENLTGSGFGAIIYTNESATSSNIYSRCCHPAGLVGLEQPGGGGGVAGTEITLMDVDGSYAIGKSITIAPNQVFTTSWAFGGGTYTSNLNSTLLSSIERSLSDTASATKKNSITERPTSNLTFAQSLYGSDTLSDPNGELRKTLDLIFIRYGSIK